MVFPTFFVQPQPPALALGEVVFHPHRQRRADPGEAVDQDADERAIAQPHQAVLRKTLEQLARFFRGKNRRSAAADDVLGPAHHGGRVGSDHLADHQPVEQHADGRQVLLDRGCGVGFAQVLDVGCHMYRLDLLELVKASAFDPAEKIRDRSSVGLPGVAVADVGGEELEKAAASVRAGGGDLGRDQGVGFRAARADCP
jgi:hypothetical protein